jgi:hypothetical protein
LMGKDAGARAVWQVLALVSLCWTSTADAARQGSMEAISTGSININVSIAARAKISRLNDIAFGISEISNATVASQDVCVWSNSLGHSYTVLAFGSGLDGAFELSNGARSIDYYVEWSSRVEQSADGKMFFGSAADSLNAATTEAGCMSGQGLARLIVAVDPAQFQAAEQGTPYTGSLTLTISPQ